MGLRTSRMPGPIQLYFNQSPALTTNLHFAEEVLSLLGGPRPPVEALDDAAQEPAAAVRPVLVFGSGGRFVFRRVLAGCGVVGTGHRRFPGEEVPFIGTKDLNVYTKPYKGKRLISIVSNRPRKVFIERREFENLT